MHPIVKDLGLLLILASALLVADRIFRLEPILNGFKEGLVNTGTLINGTTSRIGVRCGTDIGGCGDSGFCGNGFCIDRAPPSIREKYPLPVLP